MKRFKTLLTAAALLSLFVSVFASKTAVAVVPQLINFQGILKDGSGNPVTNGSYSVTFTIYDAAVGGSNLWTETQSVTTSGGLFAVLLGSTNPVPDSVFKSTDRYLGIAVSPDPELSPRQRLVSVGYSYRVNSVDSASGGTITSKVSIGPGHTNTGSNAFVVGENNTVSSDNATVGGGAFNAANGFGATVSGGRLDTASSAFAAVGGGVRNIATANQTTIAGGGNNTASGNYATIGGGQFNLSSGVDATVSGGTFNVARNGPATVSGGISNIADGTATVGGGEGNRATGYGATVSGGSSDSASNFLATVGGGGENTAGGSWSTVPGGLSNRAGGDYSFAAGYRAKAIHSGTFVWADDGGGFPGADFVSTATNQFLIRSSGGVGIGTNSPTTTLQVAGTIYSTSGGYKFPDGSIQTTAAGGGGGSFLPLAGGTMTGPITNTGNPSITMGKGNFGTGNSNPGSDAFVAGQNNKARGLYSVVAGGGGAGPDSNSAIGDLSVVSGGSRNVVSAAIGTISGGFANMVSGPSGTVGGGLGNTASGSWSTVPGGETNTASGNLSFAAGFGAKANHIGSFVWADATGANLFSSADNEFSVRASGGTRIFSNASSTAGVTLAAGASAWASVSDSTLKRNIRVVDGKEILEKVAQLPIKQWSYKTQDPKIEHIGPMAQDFYPLFQVGDDEKTISTIDPPGIALAAIQELYKTTQELNKKTAEIDGLNARLAELQELVQKLLAEKAKSEDGRLVNSTR